MKIFSFVVQIFTLEVFDLSCKDFELLTLRKYKTPVITFAGVCCVSYTRQSIVWHFLSVIHVS